MYALRNVSAIKHHTRQAVSIASRKNFYSINSKNTPSKFTKKMEKVCVYGSGNWGTTAARIIAENIVKYPNEFNKTVTFYVHPMDVNGKQLTDIINETHENVKYLPGYKIPENVVATSDINEALKDVTMMVLVVPHQFLDGSLKQIIDCIDGPNGENAKNRKLKKVISLIKGLTITEENIETITQFVERKLNIKASVLSGANVATEIASREFSETTIGYHDLEEAKQWKKLFETDYFLVRCIEDVYGVEVCGALKNIVAVGVGIAEGLGCGGNAKAAIIREGLMETNNFGKHAFNTFRNATLVESCGMADMIASSIGGRNYRLSAEFVRTGKSFDVLENELIGGQKLQGPSTSLEVYLFLKASNMLDKFPLFVNIYRICYEKAPPASIFNYAMINSQL